MPLFKGKEKKVWREFSGNPEDFRLTLVEHLEELRDRIIRSLWIIVATWTIGWFLEKPVFKYLDDMATRAIIKVLQPGQEYKPVFGHATDPFLLKVRVSFMIGLVLAFPFLVLQLWGFISPALRPKEAKPLKRLAPISLILFFMGAGFAWAVLPSAMTWFATYIEEFPGTSLYQEAGAMVFFILKMLAAFGVAFQLPLIVYILGALELLSAETLMKYWRQSATAIFVIAMIVTPSQDPMTMLMMAIPLVILFMASVYAVRFTQNLKRKRKGRILEPEEVPSDVSDSNVGNSNEPPPDTYPRE